MPYASREVRLKYLRDYHANHRESILQAARDYRKNNLEEVRKKERDRLNKNKGRINEMRRLRYIKNRDKILEQAKVYAAKNKERLKIKHRQYYLENRDKILENSRLYHQKNSERRKSWWREYFSKNKERIKEWQSQYAKDYPEIYSRAAARRDSRKTNQYHPDCDEEAVKRLFKLAKEMEQKTGIPHHVDHIIPLAAGGWHHQDNLYPLPASLNCSKRHLIFWLSPSPEYKDWRSVPEYLWPENIAPEFRKRLEAMSA